MKTTDYELIFELYDKGLSWDEIKDELPWFTDTDRKKFYGYKEAMESMTEKLAEGRLAQRQQNIRIERKVLGYERSINNEQIRDIALSKTLSNQLKQALKEEVPIKLSKPSFFISDIDKRHFVLTTADLHHDGDEKELRLVFQEALDEAANFIKDNKVKKLTLVEMGDLIEGAGNLRASQAQAVRAGMVTQMVQAMKAYAEFIKELSKLVHLNLVIITSSNHTQLRLMGSKQNELVEEDLMLTFAEYIAGRFPDLKIVADKAPNIKIGYYNVKFIHGHTVKSKQQAETEIQNLSAYTGEEIDYLVMGHYHHLRMINILEAEKSGESGFRVNYDKSVIFVPSMDRKTRSTFEEDRKLSSAPGLGLLEFDYEEGLVTVRKLKL